MPLEDVQYMQEHSVIDSRLIFIDSSKRKKDQFPHPHKYIIEFNEPFTNVCGIEILDAMIPSTMYNVEKFNNTTKYHQILIMNPGDNAVSDDSIIIKLLDELQYNPEFVKRFNYPETSRIVICNNDVTDTLINIDTTSQFDRVLIVTRVFEFINTSFYQVPFDFTPTSSQYMFSIRGLYYVIDNWYPNDLLLVKIKEGSVSIEKDTNGLLSKIIYFKSFYISIDSFKQEYQNIVDNGNVSHIIHNGYIEIPPGNYDILTLQTKMNSIINATNDDAPWSYIEPFFNKYRVNIIPADDATNVTLHMRYDFVIEEGVYNRLLLNPGKTSMVDILGINIPYPAGEYPSNCFTSVFFNNDLLMMSKYTSGRTILGTPGIINLSSSVGYMLLRCPEIESHLHNSFASSGYCPGIGLFKHTGNNDQNNYRFDYTNFQKKPFHPIGKLKKLTISFELSNGISYDFKGADHILIASIKYYTPKDSRKLGESYKLNPNYNPDFLTYMVDRQVALRDLEKTFDTDEDNDLCVDEDYETYTRDKIHSDLKRDDVSELMIQNFILENNKYSYESD